LISTIFLEGAIGASAVALVAGVISIIRSGWRIQRDVRRLVVMDKLRADDLEQIAKIQRPMLKSLKACLEAQRDGMCNGNVIEAHADVSEALDNYTGYLATLVRRGR
jgi:hypothetical protein